MSVRVGIDVGGTFTDLAVFDPATGSLHVSKSPSTPQRPVDGVLSVLEKADLLDIEIDDLVHGTTVATNALLERKKALPGLVTTQGFRDVVFIQRMNRKHHYDLSWDKPEPYVERRHCMEVPERVDYRGRVVRPLDEEAAAAAVERLRDEGVRDIAVSFLFSYVNPEHELRMREIIARVHPEATVSLSHEVYPRWREYDRTSTVLADSFLKSLVADYLGNLAGGLEERSGVSNLLVMKSNGGVEDYRAASSKPVDLIVSGPVGGVLSTLFFGRMMGRSNLISMDMGGTSFDVSLIVDGQAHQTAEFEIEWGLPVYTPMLDVKTIGAGGGSIAWIDKGGLLRVGPESAGSQPGPACYGRGGTRPTVTDANLVLGRLNPGYFLGGEMSLDVDAARAALAGVADPLGQSVEEVAASVIDLVDSEMVNAIRLVSIDRGLDPREFTLVSFGGAASLHAAALGEIAGVHEVIVPVHQGVFSALGLMTADMRVDESVTAHLRSDLLRAETVDGTVQRIRTRALERLRDEGYEGAPLVEPTAELRYLGQNYSLRVPIPMTGGRVTADDVARLLDSFHAEHRRRYGYDISDEVIELVDFTITAVGPTADPSVPRLEPGERDAGKGSRPVYFRGEGWIQTSIYDRDRLAPGATVEGPAVVEERMSTTLVLPGQSLAVDDYGNCVLRTTVGRQL
jgi:N-methylhydantoinase A